MNPFSAVWGHAMFHYENILLEMPAGVYPRSALWLLIVRKVGLTTF